MDDMLNANGGNIVLPQEIRSCVVVPIIRVRDSTDDDGKDGSFWYPPRGTKIAVC